MVVLRAAMRDILYVCSLDLGRATPPDGLGAGRFRRVSQSQESTPPDEGADGSLDLPYPEHWEADVLLRDGHTAHLRPIRPDDRDRLVDFYDQVSDQSKYYRFFAPMPRLSDRDLTRFTNVDYSARVAFVITIAGDIVGVGRYDALDGPGTVPGDAEVAFLVQDKHHGRGIAQLLLEHLAQAGRECGISRFVAEVLPENVKMLGVFRDAGYKLAGGYEDGVMHYHFSIDPTDTAVGVMRDREHSAEAASIAAFFRARGIAVVGASRKQDTIGQALVRHLVLGDFTGRVYAVNPTTESIAGLPAYPTVADIPGDVDLAIVAVPADAVADVVLDCAVKGVHGLIVISSGFADTGEDGRDRQRQLLTLARSYGLRLIGPNCLGIINTDPEVSMNASLSSHMPQRGRAGFFCQSGALGSAILERASNRGLGLSTFVSAGNRADVSGNDLLQYWEKDPATEVILLYLESIGNPRKFSRIARRVSREKPIVAVRSGRTTQGVPMGHTVPSIEAPQEAVDAMFAQAGVIRVDTLDEMFDVAQLVAHQPLPKGNRVAVVGNSDALGLLAADAAASQGLHVVKSVSLGADATAESFEKALDAAIDDAGVDSVIALYIPPLNTTGEPVANVLAAVGEQSDKPLVCTFLASEGVPELLRIPDLAGSVVGRGSVPSYPAVESAVRALARVVEYSAWLAQPDAVEIPYDDVNRTAAKKQLGKALRKSPTGRQLTQDEVTTLLGHYGITLWPRVDVSTEKEAIAAGADLGWDVVLKATAERLRNRPDMAHVWRSINNEADMREAWADLNDLIDEPTTAEFVVQRHAPAGVPVCIESLEDPLFGPAVSFAIAGALSELVGDKVFRIPPISSAEVADMVRAPRASPLLFGYRGSEQVDVAAVEDLLRRVAVMKDDLPQLQRLELSLVHASADGAHVLSARAWVAQQTDARTAEFVRRLPSA